MANFTNPKILVFGGAALLLFVVVSLACADRDRPLAPAVPTSAALMAADLLHCPAPAGSLAASASLGPEGGTVALGRHEMNVPAGALARPVRFVVEEVDSPYLEIRVTADGMSDFDFNAPVRITMSYARCGDSLPADAELTVWKVHPETKERLRHMGGQDRRSTRSITFSTRTLSNFVIAT